MKVFITGASSGIGAAFARYYAARGCVVGLQGRREAALREVAASLCANSSLHICDVRDAHAMSQAGEAFLQQHGGIDLVIANAGVSSGSTTERLQDDRVFREVFDTNVLGVINSFRPFIPVMRQARSGTLVGMASVAGFRGLPGACAYSASKAALITYLESLRVELSATGIEVLTLCPGYIDTPMTQGNPYRMPFLLSPEDAAQRMARLISQGRRRAVVPWQMAIVGYLLRNIPGFLYDKLMARAPRKPRTL